MFLAMKESSPFAFSGDQQHHRLKIQASKNRE
jgi:hypothetical protein